MSSRRQVDLRVLLRSRLALWRTCRTFAYSPAYRSAWKRHGKAINPPRPSCRCNRGPRGAPVGARGYPPSGQFWGQGAPALGAQPVPTAALSTSRARWCHRRRPDDVRQRDFLSRRRSRLQRTRRWQSTARRGLGLHQASAMARCDGSCSRGQRPDRSASHCLRVRTPPHSRRPPAGMGSLFLGRCALSATNGTWCPSRKATRERVAPSLSGPPNWERADQSFIAPSGPAMLSIRRSITGRSVQAVGNWQ